MRTLAGYRPIAIKIPELQRRVIKVPMKLGTHEAGADKRAHARRLLPSLSCRFTLHLLLGSDARPAIGPREPARRAPSGQPSGRPASLGLAWLARRPAGSAGSAGAAPRAAMSPPGRPRTPQPLRRQNSDPLRPSRAGKLAAPARPSSATALRRAVAAAAGGGDAWAAPGDAWLGAATPSAASSSRPSTASAGPSPAASQPALLRGPAWADVDREGALEPGQQLGWPWGGPPSSPASCAYLRGQLQRQRNRNLACAWRGSPGRLPEGGRPGSGARRPPLLYS